MGPAVVDSLSLEGVRGRLKGLLLIRDLEGVLSGSSFASLEVFVGEEGPADEDFFGDVEFNRCAFVGVRGPFGDKEPSSSERNASSIRSACVTA